MIWRRENIGNLIFNVQRENEVLKIMNEYGKKLNLPICDIT